MLLPEPRTRALRVIFVYWFLFDLVWLVVCECVWGGGGWFGMIVMIFVVVWVYVELIFARGLTPCLNIRFYHYR